MSETRVYCYANCGTCRKALKWLDGQGITYRELPIRETPPSVAELRLALRELGTIRKLINTSSQDYRELGLKDRLEGMETEAVFALLRENGNLVKRPFVVANGTAWTGFREADWEARLG